MRSQITHRHNGRSMALCAAALAGLLITPSWASAGTILPVAVAMAAPTTVFPGGVLGRVTFGHYLSYHPDPSRSISSYEWDFLGDGSYDVILTNPTSTPVYTYLNPGLFNATLRVTDDLGFTDTDSVRITVVHEPEYPPACDAGGPYTFGPGRSLTLNATAIDANFGDVLTAAWDIDLDGQYDDASGLTPTIPFAMLYPLAQPDGSFDIMLRVTDQTGRASVASASVTYVVPAPAAAWMGLSLLGGLGIVHGLRRKHDAKKTK